MRIVDLTFVLVQDTISLILQVWLVITSLCQDDDLHITEGVSAPLIHVVS